MRPHLSPSSFPVGRPSAVLRPLRFGGRSFLLAIAPGVGVTALACQGVGGRPQAAPTPGLVERVTSHTRRSVHGTNEYIKSECYRGLNSKRRVSRMRRVVVSSADAARESMERGGHRVRAAFVTLTYRPGVLWDKRHVSGFTKCFRQWCVRRGVACRYQWVIELTRSGVPHYHVLLWLPRSGRIPKPDQAGWWTHGLSRVESARRPVGYLVKYTSKGFDSETAGEIPAGARLFGCANSKEERHAVGRARLPVWLAKCTENFQLPKRKAFVGFVCNDTGEVYRSPFELHVIRGEDGRYEIVFLEKVEA